MITENFLDSCFSACYNNDSTVKKSKDLYQDLYNILNDLKKKQTIGVSIELKLELLIEMLNLSIKGKNLRQIVETINFDKYESLKAYLQFKITEQLSEEDLNTINEDISNRRNLILISDKMNDIEKLSTYYKNSNYNTFYDLMDKFFEFETKLHMDVKECIRKNIDANTRIVDLSEYEELENVNNRILSKYDRSKRIPTGFELLDNTMIGGAERGRLYIYGGSSGSGKSTMLINQCINAATYQHYIGELKDKLKIFIYITLENSFDESVNRIYSSHWGISQIEVINKLQTDGKLNVAKEFASEMRRYNSKIKVCYYPIESLNASMIETLIDEFIDDYGGVENCLIGAIYIDYLDLLKSNTVKKDQRLNVNAITQDLKNLAVNYDIPVITATQLNRNAYRVTNAFQLNPAFMSESIGKNNIADFVAMIAKDSSRPDRVFFKITKFRSGVSDIAFDFKVNFEHFRYVECIRSASVESNDINEDDEGRAYQRTNHLTVEYNPVKADKKTLTNAYDYLEIMKGDI